MPLQFEKLQYIYCLYHVDRIYSHGFIADIWPEIIIMFLHIVRIDMKNVKEEAAKVTIKKKKSNEKDSLQFYGSCGMSFAMIYNVQDELH